MRHFFENIVQLFIKFTHSFVAIELLTFCTNAKQLFYCSRELSLFWLYKKILPTAGSSVHVQDVSRPLHGHTPIDFGKETGFGLPTTRAKNRNQNFGQFRGFKKKLCWDEVGRIQSSPLLLIHSTTAAQPPSFEHVVGLSSYVMKV